MELTAKYNLLVIPAIAAGVVIFVVLLNNRAEPGKTPLAKVSRAV